MICSVVWWHYPTHFFSVKQSLENKQPALGAGITAQDFSHMCSLDKLNPWAPPLALMQQPQHLCWGCSQGMSETKFCASSRWGKHSHWGPLFWVSAPHNSPSGYKRRTLVLAVSGEKMTHFSYERQALLLCFRQWLPSGQTASVPCQGRDQSFSCTACDLCVAFQQSWGFRAHRNQPKQQDVHRFTDTRETRFFRAQLCFSGFFLLHFSVKRNSTTVVNCLWGWGFCCFFVFFFPISFLKWFLFLVFLL